MSVIEEIKERLDVVEIITAYAPLRKSGRNYKALCPFHQEKTPSFVVFPDTGTWRCFGACGVGGDIFSFIMKRENLDFREALEMLAAKAGVSLAAPDPAQAEEDQALERLREISQAAAIYFHNLLRNAPQAQTARHYLAGRGLNDATIDAFLLGYASDSWDALLRHLSQKNYALTDIVAAGLVVERVREDGRSSHYDRFRHRVMTPIRDVRGRIIGFGARALAGDQQPKYLNTPQTPLFDKSSVLFGLDMARKAIRARGQAIIVEGYMDVLAAYQHGEANVVASMGTALTEQQLRRLKRYTNTFILALDADAAGQAATLRGIDQARQALDREWVPTVTATGLVRQEARLAAQLRIMTLPEGQDPDDVIRTDLDLWQQLVAAARPVVDYFFDLARQNLDLNSAQGKSTAVERLAPLIREVADDVQRTHYTQQLARLVQTDERTVARLILRRRPPAVRAEAHEEDARRPGEAAARRPWQRPNAVDHCLALLILHPHFLPQLQTELAELGVSPLDEDDFSQTESRAVCAALLAGAIREGGEWPQADANLQQHLARLREYGAGLQFLSQQQLSKDAVDSVLRLRIANLKARTRQLPALLQEAETQGDHEQTSAYRQMLQDWGRQRRTLEQALNARTLVGRRQALPSF